MDEKRTNINKPARDSEDLELERMLGELRPVEFDNSRIKSLFADKVEADRQRVRRFRRRVWGSVAGAAAVVAAVLTVSIGLTGGQAGAGLSTMTQEKLADAGYTEIHVAPGHRDEIKLPDGSVLMANAGTRVIYPDEFKGGERRIYADGEIYINVAKDREHPFVVESKDFDVRVLGTTFNVCNTSDSTASVVLVEGSVELTGKSAKQTVKLRPGDMAELLNGSTESIRQVDTDDYTSWTDGLISLRGESLGNLSKRLGRFYGIDISCDASLSGVKVYGKLDLRDSVEQVLSSIEEIVPMNITRNGSRVRLGKPKS